MSFTPSLCTPSFAYQNSYQSTLSAGITASDTVIPITALPVGTEGTLIIEPGTANEEEIYYTSLSAGVVNCPSAALGRGVNSTAVAHNSGVAVKMLVTKASLDATRAIAAQTGVLGYAEATSSFGWTGTDDNDITGLTATVTVPAGGRRVKITVQCGYYTCDAISAYDIKIQEGATVLNYTENDLLTAGKTSPAQAMAIITPTAGAHTYKAVVKKYQSGTGSLLGSATSPAFILVEYLGGV